MPPSGLGKNVLNFHDYVLLPTKKDEYHTALKALMKHRPATILFENNYGLQSSISEVKDRLKDDKKKEGKEILKRKPLKDLIVCSHANETGWMEFDLNILQKDMDFDDLLEIAKTTKYFTDEDKELLEPRPFKNGKGVEPFLYIKGCNIGQRIEYLNKLREIFGNNFNVTAPKFYYGLLRDKDFGAEYFLYDFRVCRPKEFKTIDKAVWSFKDKYDSWDWIGSGPKDIGNFWSQWIPQNFNSLHVQKLPVVKVKLKTGNYEIPVEMKPRYIHKHTSPKKYFQRIPCPEEPKNENDAKQTICKYLLEKLPCYKRNEFPEYERLGYKTMAEFMDGYTWDVEWKKSGVLEVKRAIRHEYLLKFPIYDFNTKKLFANYYPFGNGKPNIDVEDDDKRFFGCSEIV